jgi:hypothetical protein
MSIKINQYEASNLDAKTTEALRSVMETLEKQAEHVKEVTVLSNFSIDTSNTLKYGQLVTQGLVVQVNPSYSMSSEDMSWFHPNIGAGRSLFSIDQPLSKSVLQSVVFENDNCSVGEYLTTTPDEFGSSEVSHHLVVDSAPDFSSMYSSFLNSGLTAGEIQAQWKSNGRQESTHLRHRSISNVVKSDPMYSDITNDILSDMQSIYFTNNVVKQKDGKLLMKSSALGGYRQYDLTNKTRMFYPATLGTSSNYYKWSSMKAQNVNRISETCSWSAEQIPFNTQVMTPPSLKGAAIRTMEDSYEMTGLTSLVMRLSHLSNDASIVDKMAPADVLSLTPEHNVESISAPIDSGHEVFQKLMANLVSIQQTCPEFQLLNPKFVKGGRLSLPLDVYKQIV